MRRGWSGWTSARSTLLGDLDRGLESFREALDLLPEGSPCAGHRPDPDRQRLPAGGAFLAGAPLVQEGPGIRRQASALSGMGLAWQRLGQPGRALPLFERSLALFDAPAEKAAVWCNIGRLHLSLGGRVRDGRFRTRSLPGDLKARAEALSGPGPGRSHAGRLPGARSGWSRPWIWSSRCAPRWAARRSRAEVPPRPPQGDLAGVQAGRVRLPDRPAHGEAGAGARVRPQGPGGQRTGPGAEPLRQPRVRAPAVAHPPRRRHGAPRILPGGGAQLPLVDHRGPGMPPSSCRAARGSKPRPGSSTADAPAAGRAWPGSPGIAEGRRAAPGTGDAAAEPSGVS